MLPTSWKYQDVLRLSVDQWVEALRDPQIFDTDAVSMIQFVYHQKNNESTASKIADFFSTVSQKVHYTRICAWNRKVAKALYNIYNVEPPVDENAEKRYWNVVFDGEPENPLDKHNHFYWRLRPNLVKAIETVYSGI
ncbi:MAG TPA: hypothetical protein VHO66_10325 [Ruminiclostridium sp.]|nr:hypothetical protein [Ruminiclostridium sp.]